MRAAGAIEARGTPAAQMDLNSDGEQISYTTPSFGGFQVAVGYASNNRETFDGLEGANSAFNDDIFDIGVRYMGKVGDVSFRVGGGMATANNNNVVNEEDDKQWMFGGSARFGAIQLAASYSQEEARNALTTELGHETGTLELGVRAWMGPNQFSLAYSRSEAKSTRVALDGDEETVVILAMRRSLGKGVRWHNSLWYYNAEDGSPTKLSTTDNDGLAFTTGIRVGF